VISSSDNLLPIQQQKRRFSLARKPGRGRRKTMRFQHPCDGSAIVAKKSSQNMAPPDHDFKLQMVDGSHVM
jgi:hypothetical protein